MNNFRDEDFFVLGLFEEIIGKVDQVGEDFILVICAKSYKIPAGRRQLKRVQLRKGMRVGVLNTGDGYSVREVIDD